MSRITSTASQKTSSISLPELSPGQDSALARNTLALLELCRSKSLDAITVGGWHGTSEAAMRLALRVGGLRGSPIAHSAAAPGHLFFYRTESEDFASDTDFRRQLLGRGGAEGYAVISAQTSRVLEALGMDFNNPEHHYRSDALRDLLREDLDDGQRELRRLGMRKAAINSLVGDLWSRKGFLIALNKAALERHEITDGDITGEDLKIFVPDVLPFADMAAIIPLGEPERRWVESLRSTPGTHAATHPDCASA